MKPGFYDFRLSQTSPFHLMHFRSGPFNQPRPPDIHEAVHLGIVLKGDISGTRAPGCYLIGSWEPHGSTGSISGFELLLITVDPQELGKAFLDAREKLELLLNLPQDVRASRLKASAIRKGLTVFARELLKIKEDKSEFHIFRQWLIIQQLFLHILDHLKLDGIQPVRQNPSRLLPALRLVAEEPDKRHTVAEGAASCGLGSSRFAVLFREFFGLSFGTYELNYRLNGAAKDFERGDKLCKDIVKDWGFYDESHLRKSYRRHFPQIIPQKL